MNRPIQYPYAYDENNNLVFIRSIKREHRHDHVYHCPNCGHEMAPRIGGHNQPYFAHSENQACGVESYLHKTAKLIFAERFNNGNLPFVVHFRAEQSCENILTCKKDKYIDCCCCPKKKIDYDLTKDYDLPAEIEVNIWEPDGVSRYRPDVLLKSSNPRRKDIFLEVYHTSPCSKEKIQSGHRIIELHIRDLFRLEELKTKTDFTEDKDTSFYNFKIELSPVKVLKCRQTCANECGTIITPNSFPPCLSDTQSIQTYGRCTCGGRLILRNGPYGSFYGCSNYPSCKMKYRTW